jgi:hypothetical protein
VNVCFRLFADIDPAAGSGKTVYMHPAPPGHGPSGNRLCWTAATLVALAVPSSLTANTPLPMPVKLAENVDFTCRMLSEREPPATLVINLQYEAETYHNSFNRFYYWWTVSGDKTRFPSNTTFMNMKSAEINEPTSRLWFVAADGWRYLYTLYYGIKERYPSFYYVPDHLTVRRWHDAEAKSDAQLVGIGECQLNSQKPAQ